MSFNRREFIKTVSMLAFSGTSVLKAAKSGARKPNVIYILADDLGYGDLGCYGQKLIKTPNIDRMAKEGMKFTQHYSGSALCAPSRCSLITGKHTGHTFVRNNKPLPYEGNLPIPKGEVTIAEIMKQGGYVTACIGKWGLGYPGSEGDPNRGPLYFVISTISGGTRRSISLRGPVPVGTQYLSASFSSKSDLITPRITASSSPIEGSSAESIMVISRSARSSGPNPAGT